ncbi:GFA family protein [Caulobacter segnis]|nr:GFA family protein [Caulobacter segnis]
MTIHGSCCCGRVKFELLEPPRMMGTCHCSRCRKVGASTFVIVSRSTLKWLNGREAVIRYAPEPPYKYGRCFCGVCGTALGEILSEDETFPIAAHALDDDPQVRNRFHEFVAEKPDWYGICDEAKQFPGHPG